jgi:hypothetical protein
MAYNARWYTEEGNLRTIGRDHLRRLLDHYSEKLREEDITIEEPEEDDAYYRSLVEVFMRPAGIPNELHDALYFIKGLDNARGEARLVEAVHRGRLPSNLNGDRSTADKALLAWLADEKLVRQLFLEVGLDASRSFLHLRAVSGASTRVRSFESVKNQLESDLAQIFSEHSRAEWARVTLHKRETQWVFVVERTDPFRRETKHEDNGTKPLYYWPTEQDLVVYDEEAKDLRMNVVSKWQKEKYAELFGHHLFGNKSLFRETPKYTLQPILDRGRGVLEGGAYGIKGIRLSELACKVDVDENDYRIRRADDVFSAYDNEGGIPNGEDLAWAKFAVKFEDGTGERTVTIQPPNRAKYMQDQNGTRITEWMKAHGFIVESAPQEHESLPVHCNNEPPRQTVAVTVYS